MSGLDRDKKDFHPHMRDGKTPRCQEQVCRYTGNWPHFGQCERSAKVGDRCRQHDPVAIEARKRATREREDEEYKQHLMKIYGPRFFNVLKQIAAGHNDPRRLAQDTIDEFNKKG